MVQRTINDVIKVGIKRLLKPMIQRVYPKVYIVELSNVLKLLKIMCIGLYHFKLSPVNPFKPRAIIRARNRRNNVARG